jgi:Ice-binding-like
MSHPFHLTRTQRAGIAVAVGCAFVAVPAAAHASPVNLGTAAPFVVLGGSTVTNTGPSVLDGALGVSPGSSLPGFGPATINGTVHDNDAVAAQAQLDLTAAYDVAAGQPVAPADVLTGDLGGRVLTAGAYRYTSAAQLTGPLTLDAQGDPSAQFVFEIGTTLTTASGSSVLLVNGASPCNVYWQVATSATLGTSTAFEGNVLALASISLNTGATVQGRVLARNAAVTLDSNVIDASMCGTSTTPPPTPPPPTPPTATPPSTTTVPPRNGTVTWKRTATPSGQEACAAGFSATVRGHLIKRVLFRLDGKKISAVTKSPFRVFVQALPGKHNVTASVSFKDATRSKTLKLGYRACAAAAFRPRLGPSQFTG